MSFAVDRWLNGFIICLHDKEYISWPESWSAQLSVNGVTLGRDTAQENTLWEETVNIEIHRTIL